MYNFSVSGNKDPYAYDINEPIQSKESKGIGGLGLGKKKPFSAGIGILYFLKNKFFKIYF
jgi:hypothetical protein